MDIVGATASIVQLIDVAARIILRIKEYNDVRGNVPKVFRDISNRLPLFIIEVEALKERLENSINDARSGLTVDHINALNKLIGSCLDVIQQIYKLQSSVLIDPKDSKPRRVGKALLSIIKDKDIANEWDRLQSHQAALLNTYKSLPKPTPSLSLLQDSAPSPIIYEVGAQRTTFFVDRPTILHRIEEAFAKPTPSSVTKVTVLLGLGGQGKTQMALEHCRIEKSKGNLRAIFWINASSPDALRGGYRVIAGRIQPQSSFKDDDDAVKFTIQYLASWDHPWLIVLDNLDRPDEMANIREYLPQSSVGHILITSRHEATKELGSSIALDAMEEEEALELLLRCVTNEAAESSLPTAKAVVSRLGRLPLAIDHARAYITLRQLTLASFLREYEIGKTKIMKTTPALSEYRRSQGSHEQQSTLSVFTTWEMSLEQLLASIEDPDDIRDVLQLLASFYHRGISETLVSAYAVDEDREIETPASYFVTNGAWDHEQFETLIIWMKMLSLIQFTRLANNGISLTLHPLVAEWLSLKGGRVAADQVTKLSVLHVASYAGTFPDLGMTSFSLRQQLLTHLDHIHPQMALISQRKNILQIANLYLDLGRPAEAEKLYKMVLAGSEKARGMEHILTLGALDRLGNLYAGMGRFAESERMYNKALAGKEEALGSGHILTLGTLNGLGLLYMGLGRLEEAERMYNRALAGKEKALGPEHTSALDTVNNLGILYTDMDRLEEAERMYNRALVGYEKVLGSEHTVSLDTMNNLGVLYAKLGRFEEAESMYKRALTGYEKVLGSEHSSTLETVNNFGTLYQGLGRFEEARSMYNRALEGFTKALGSEHRLTLITVSNIRNLQDLSNAKPS
jgi:tetratricopeptide (TPR) repeat protein